MTKKQNKNTAGYQFGYTQEAFDLLMEKADKIYDEYIEPNDDILKKEIFDKIVEVSTDPKDIYLMTIAIEHLINEEYNAYKDFCRERAEA